MREVKHPITPDILSADADMVVPFVAHLVRHLAESNGRHGYFHPFSDSHTWDKETLAIQIGSEWQRPLSEVGWTRAWIWIPENQREIRAHGYVRGPTSKSSSHRVTVGIGVESMFRNQGIGHELLGTIMTWIRTLQEIEWVDAFVLNPKMERFLARHGFSPISTITDRYRINGISLDEKIFVAPLRSPPPPSSEVNGS